MRAPAISGGSGPGAPATGSTGSGGSSHCAAGTADCDGDPANGCEANLGANETCGSCTTQCGPTANGEETCVGGTCLLACAAGFGDCDDDPRSGCETDLTSDDACGACGAACTCELGQCHTPCDAGLIIDDPDPNSAARAIGLCGAVESAAWVLRDGQPAPAEPLFDLGHGILSSFGAAVIPREGARMLAISTGMARESDGVLGGFDKGYASSDVEGFPKLAPGCTSGGPDDGIGLEIVVPVPPLATGLAFEFKFHTEEWPEWVCSEYDDEFLALLSPIPPGLPDANIAFHAMAGHFSVNHAVFLDQCGCANGPPCTAGGKIFQCPDGTSDLVGTEFELHAGTPWLETRAPAGGGTSITIRFATHDRGDHYRNTTTLIDRWRWLDDPTVLIETSVAPPP